MNILLSAYACDPCLGSEERNGWSLALGLAKLGQDVWVLTRPVGRRSIERNLEPGQYPNLRFHYVEPPAWSRPLWGGRFGWAAHYALWQQAALPAAARLDKALGFDVVHHVTWGSLKAGSELWRLGKPFLLGPVGGGQTAPPAFKDYFLDDWRFEAARSLITRRLMPLIPGVRGAIRHAARVFAGNQETLELVRALGAKRAEFLVDVGLPDDFVPDEFPARAPGRTMTLLWVGRLLPHKAPGLALEAMAGLGPRAPVKLRLIGGGPLEEFVRREAARLGLGDRVEILGQLPWEDVGRQMLQADALLFTSLRESGGVQLLEAMAKGLPIIALDHQGAQDIVPDGAGLKAPVTTPEQTVEALARAIETLAREPERRLAMGRRGWERAREETWGRRVGKFMIHYERASAA